MKKLFAGTALAAALTLGITAPATAQIQHDQDNELVCVQANCNGEFYFISCGYTTWQIIEGARLVCENR